MRARDRLHPAFTLVELLLSMTVLSVILLITLSMTNSMATLFSRTRAKIDTFQEARAGFESMTRRVSQSMLNTYWDYEYEASDAAKKKSPIGYARQSELHIVSGPTGHNAHPLLPDSEIKTVTHGIFFQAPTGFGTVKSGDEQNATLSNLLNVTGYYIDYSSDLQDRPRFLKTIVPEKHRFRLLEMNVPTENLQTYVATSGFTTSADKAFDWFRFPAVNFAKNPRKESDPRGVRMLAENIIALIVYPQRSPNDPVPEGVVKELAPAYYYDSRAYISEPTDINKRTRNQLPPIVQVTMVAIDKQSAERLMLGEADPTILPASLNLNKLFGKPSTGSGAGEEAGDQYRKDLKTLEEILLAKNLSFRIFSSSVNILQAKWSEK